MCAPPVRTNMPLIHLVVLVWVPRLKKPMTYPHKDSRVDQQRVSTPSPAAHTCFAAHGRAPRAVRCGCGEGWRVCLWRRRARSSSCFLGGGAAAGGGRTRSSLGSPAKVRVCAMSTPSLSRPYPLAPHALNQAVTLSCTYTTLYYKQDHGYLRRRS